jgi:SanA protein
VVGALVLAAILFAISANLLILHDAKSFIVSGPQAAHPAPIAIVPGASVGGDLVPSPMAVDRIETAVSLYKQGTVKAIDISGYPNEVRFMLSYAERNGVPAGDLLSDPAGSDTYDTMSNAKKLFHVEKALVCTQRFHLSRAVYLARSLGIDATGVPADRQSYPGTWFETHAREWGARVKAFLQVHL